MVYTSYEMVRDCKAGRPEGWSHFVINYVPVVRRILGHYGTRKTPDAENALRLILSRASGMFSRLDPVPERRFVAELRQNALAVVTYDIPEITIELETVAGALAPLTHLEKKAAWMEAMHYSAEQAGAMLQVAPATTAKIRERAAELIRGTTDSWRKTILQDNGIALGRAAAAAGGQACVSAKLFLDVLDGRATWQGREEIESHIAGCWHCIDHECRLVEVIDLLRHNRPLSPSEASPYLKLLTQRSGV